MVLYFLRRDGTSGAAMKRVTIYGLVSAAVVVVIAVGAAIAWRSQPPSRVLKQADIDAAVLHTLQTKSLPSRTARAAEAVRESVVEVRSYTTAEKPVEAASAPKARRDPPATRRKSSPASQPAPQDELGKREPPDGKDPAGGKREARHIGSGVVVTETVFNIPGLGRLATDAIQRRDYPVVQGLILVFSFVYVVINLLVDLSYVLFDPRVRY